MTKNNEHENLIERFGPQYERYNAPVLREIEQISIGSDYAGTSWTTRAEADDIAGRLGLQTGHRLLEVGAGAGWPSLYMVSKTGCEAVLLDLPLAGIQAAIGRARVDQTSDRVQGFVGDGAHLPFSGPTFDAIHHADVLCCMSDKSGMLQACRSIIKPDGKMVFTVIFVAPELSAAARERAIDHGPPYIASDAPYVELLAKSGWLIEHEIDLTENYFATAKIVLRELSKRTDALVTLMGQTDFDAKIDRCRRTIIGLEEGLVRRAMFVVTPASD